MNTFVYICSGVSAVASVATFLVVLKVANEAKKAGDQAKAEIDAVKKKTNRVVGAMKIILEDS